MSNRKTVSTSKIAISKASSKGDELKASDVNVVSTGSTTKSQPTRVTGSSALFAKIYDKIPAPLSSTAIADESHYTKSILFFFLMNLKRFHLK